MFDIGINDAVARGVSIDLTDWPPSQERAKCLNWSAAVIVG